MLILGVLATGVAIGTAQTSYQAHFFTDAPPPRITPGDGKLHIVGLGDSQAAGSGSATEIYRDATTDAAARYDGSCFVSRYSAVSVAARALDAEAQNFACLGATTGDVIAHQLDRVPYDTDVVVISTGANDILEHVFDDTCVWHQQRCLDLLTTAVTQDRDQLSRAVASTLKAVRNRIKPSGRIIFLGLADPWPDTRSLSCYPIIDNARLAGMQQQFSLINATLRAAAHDGGVQFIDPQAVITGDQRPCGSHSGFDDVTWPGFATSGFGPGFDVFGHLSQQGNENMGRAVFDLIQRGATQLAGSNAQAAAPAPERVDPTQAALLARPGPPFVEPASNRPTK